MIKIGVTPSLETPLPGLIRYARMAEDSGFDSVWCADHPSEGRDIGITLASVASATSELKIGPNVANPYTRPPAILASLIASLDELSNGRAILGIGSGNPERLARLGICQTKPLKHVEDTVSIVRRLLAGETFDHQSECFSLKGVGLGFKAYRKNLPIYVAGIKDRMLKLAGQIGDGVLLSMGMSPSYVRRASSLIQRARLQANRSTSLDIGATVLTAASQDSRHAKSLVAPYVARTLARKGRGELMLQSTDFDTSLLAPLRKKVEEKGAEEASKSLSRELVGSFCAFGTYHEVHQSLKQYLDAGANLLIISIAQGSDAEMAFNVLRDL